MQETEGPVSRLLCPTTFSDRASTGMSGTVTKASAPEEAVKATHKRLRNGSGLPHDDREAGQPTVGSPCVFVSQIPPPARGSRG